MLAIGIHMLARVMDAKQVSKIMLWEDMKEEWDENRTGARRGKGAV